jgi:hypothetical protein
VTKAKVRSPSAPSTATEDWRGVRFCPTRPTGEISIVTLNGHELNVEVLSQFQDGSGRLNVRLMYTFIKAGGKKSLLGVIQPVRLSESQLTRPVVELPWSPTCSPCSPPSGEQAARTTRGER